MTRHRAAQGITLRIRHIVTACVMICTGLLVGHLATRAMAETAFATLHPCGMEGCE